MAIQSPGETASMPSHVWTWAKYAEERLRDVLAALDAARAGGTL